MKNYINRIIEMGKENNARLILPETQDDRIRNGIIELKKNGFNILSPIDYQYKLNSYIEFIKKKSFTNNWPEERLVEYLRNPVHFSMVMVACNDADGLVAGAITSTSEIIRSAIRIIGVAPKSSWVSSIFFLISPDGSKAYTYADCAVIPEPDSKQLAVIAKDSSEFHQLLSNEEARVAFLSFSTKGSARHYRVEKVIEANKIFGNLFPNIIHDGELQFDSAIIPEVSSIKSPESNIKGNANVLIFPNLDAGNIAYKITQRLAGYIALGPLLQGLNKPIHDLSRGCSVEDIVNIAAITALQKENYANI
tara:strand:+ start:363 stop:1286 length:924 start_codon:yes stop_codon:yes gene_type:complete